MTKMKVKYRTRPCGYPKLRGLKRLKKKTENEVAVATLCLDDSNWLNYWHHHLDWKGLGEYSRKWLLFFAGQFHVLHYRYYKQLFSAGYDAQIWLQFDLEDFGQSGVFVHSKNPHTKYPHVFETEVISTEQVPPELRSLEFDEQLQYSITERGDISVRFLPITGI